MYTEGEFSVYYKFGFRGTDKRSGDSFGRNGEYNSYLEDTTYNIEITERSDDWTHYQLKGTVDLRKKRKDDPLEASFEVDFTIDETSIIYEQMMDLE